MGARTGFPPVRAPLALASYRGYAWRHGRPSGHHPGTMAGHRVAGTTRQRTARRTGARGPWRASTGNRPEASWRRAGTEQNGA